LIEVGIHFPSKITKMLALPLGTPNDRAQILQNELQETVKDPAGAWRQHFLSQAA